MWKHMARIIGEVRPAFAFIENSPMLRTRGLGAVLQDLAKMGYDAEWGVLSAASVGAKHKRERMWIVAYSSGERHKSQKKQICTRRDSIEYKSWWEVEPCVGRVADGVASRVDRLKSIGNGQVPLCVATAWSLLNDRITRNSTDN